MMEKTGVALAVILEQYPHLSPRRAGYIITVDHNWMANPHWKPERVDLWALFTHLQGQHPTSSGENNPQNEIKLENFQVADNMCGTIIGGKMPFIDLNTTEKQEIVPGYRASFVHSENMTLAYWDVEKDAKLPEHSHPHEQIANVLKGQFELTVNGNTRVLNPGQVAVIPAHVTHSGVAITSCKLLDAFHPTREEYK